MCIIIIHCWPMILTKIFATEKENSVPTAPSYYTNETLSKSEYAFHTYIKAFIQLSVTCSTILKQHELLV